MQMSPQKFYIVFWMCEGVMLGPIYTDLCVCYTKEMILEGTKNMLLIII